MGPLYSLLPLSFLTAPFPLFPWVPAIADIILSSICETNPLEGLAPPKPFPLQPFFFPFSAIFVFLPMKNLPLLPIHCTGQHALPASWLPAAIAHVLQPIAEARHPIHKETMSEPPPLSCSGSCTLVYRISEYTPRHEQSASTR